MSSLVGGRSRNLRVRSKASNKVSGFNPGMLHKYAHGTVETVPDPMEFIVSDRYLHRANLYPRQATIIKIVTLRDDLFTQFDHDVIGEWEEKFLSTGNEGVSPGLLDRIQINKAAGRPWFRETLGVIGRRGGKGYIGALLNAYVLWTYMHRPGGPQTYYGIDRDKRLVDIVFAGKKEQARDNLWRDITNVILGGPCFAPYISRPQAERLTVFAPTDILRAERQQALGIESEADLASFEIIPAPSTMMAARGPASFAQNYDEMAHVISSTAAADAGQVFDSATPALDQFGKDGFIYAPSSPWQKTGKFFEEWEDAIEMEPDGSPAYPEKVMFQLPSWGPYEDWDEADRIPIRPPQRKTVQVIEEVPWHDDDAPIPVIFEMVVKDVEQITHAAKFKPLKSAVQSYDEDMRQLERSNPDTFKVERKSHWATALSSYLAEKKVKEAFLPWAGEEGSDRMSARAKMSETYLAHGDPANTNKRFGWSLGHRVWVPILTDEGKPAFEPDGRTPKGDWHVVIDLVRCWDPADYEDHILDYDDVMGDIEEDVKTFLPEIVSFDQFNVPATVGRLKKFVATREFPKNVQVHEVTRTRPVNWQHYEIFKAALNLGLVHIPVLRADGEKNFASGELLNELLFLEEKNGAVDHPTSGPVQTKDIADALCETVVGLIGKHIASLIGIQFEALGLSGAAPHGSDPYARAQQENVSRKFTEAQRGVGQRGMAQGPAARGGMRRR